MNAFHSLRIGLYERGERVRHDLVRSGSPSSGALGLLVVLLVATSGVFGCGRAGPAIVPAAGIVRFEDGQPVLSGLIEFTTVDDRFTARARIGRDGRFQLGTAAESDGAVVGRHRVVVSQLVPTEDVPQAGHAAHGLVHSRFADYATSGLTIEVPPGGSRDLVITVAPGAR